MPRLAQRRRSGHALAVDEHLAFADQRKRHVRERREVAGGADRALRGHVRHQSRVVHGDQRVDDFFPHAGRTAREARGLEREHQAHHRRRQRIADTDAVRSDQVELKRGEIVLADARLRELAEAGIDAIDRRVAARGALHDVGRCLQRRAYRRIERERHAARVDRGDLGEAELAGDDVSA